MLNECRRLAKRTKYEVSYHNIDKQKSIVRIRLDDYLTRKNVNIGIRRRIKEQMITEFFRG